MSETKAPEWRDPVQLYRARARRRWLLVLGVVVVALVGVVYWYVYVV